jgi:hypothetical protein
VDGGSGGSQLASVEIRGTTCGGRGGSGNGNAALPFIILGMASKAKETGAREDGQSTRILYTAIAVRACELTHLLSSLLRPPPDMT